MQIAPQAAVNAETPATPTELRATTTRWSIAFDVPVHPGVTHGAQLFSHYGGLEVQVRASKDQVGALRVAVTGTAAELQRVINWYDQLLDGRKHSLHDAFAGEAFMQVTATAAGPSSAAPPNRGGLA